MRTGRAKIGLVMASFAAGWICLGGVNTCNSQTPSANAPGPSSELEEVVKLSKAKMTDEVITNMIKSSGKSYRLTADDILYLNSQGVSQGVIAVLQTVSTAAPAPAAVPTAPAAPAVVQSAPPATTVADRPSAPVTQPSPAPVGIPLTLDSASAPASTAAPAPGAAAVPNAPSSSAQTPAGAPNPADNEPNLQYFHEQLSPFGTWVEVPQYGEVWKPGDGIIAASPDWRPYYDNGQWIHTDNGLFWQSDYTWGDIPFHYGRWVRPADTGWVWVPDYTWGPAWVFWRHDEADGAMGWAALPPGAVFADGVFVYGGVRVAADFTFGLGEDSFVFVDGAHFHEHFLRLRGREFRYHVGAERLHHLYTRSVVRNEFRRDEQGRFVNEGIGHKLMEHSTHLQHASFEERKPVGDREKAASQRAKSSASSATAKTSMAKMASGATHSMMGTGGIAKMNSIYRPPAASAVSSKSSSSSSNKKGMF